MEYQIGMKQGIPFVLVSKYGIRHHIWENSPSCACSGKRGVREVFCPMSSLSLIVSRKQSTRAPESQRRPRINAHIVDILSRSVGKRRSFRLQTWQIQSIFPRIKTRQIMETTTNDLSGEKSETRYAWKLFLNLVPLLNSRIRISGFTCKFRWNLIVKASKIYMIIDIIQELAQTRRNLITV